MHHLKTALLLVLFGLSLRETHGSKEGKRDKKLLGLTTESEQDSEEENTTEMFRSQSQLHSMLRQGIDEKQHSRSDATLPIKEESFSASLLLDIRDLLYREMEDKNQLFQDRVEQNRLESIAQETQVSVDSMSGEIERYREFANERVELVLESFSTLKLLVISQGNQLKEAMERLEKLDEATSQVQSQFIDVQRSLDDVKAMQRVIGLESATHEASSADLRDETSSSSSDTINDKINNINTIVVSLQNDVKVIQSNITELFAMSQEITVEDNRPSASPQIITQSDDKCQCPIDDITQSITKLEQNQETQNNVVQELTKNLTLVQAQRYQQQVDSTFRNRLGEVEGSLKDLTEMKREVSAVKETLDVLKDELEDGKDGFPALLSNRTAISTSRGICVWPYTRCGDSCFSVHTDRRLNWVAARDYCKGIQGDLAIVSSLDDFSNFMRHQRVSRVYFFWLGASDISNEGAWTWLDGTSLLGSSAIWSQDRPRLDHSSNCLAFKPNSRFDIIGTDEECRVSRYFVCEQERLL